MKATTAAPVILPEQRDAGVFCAVGRAKNAKPHLAGNPRIDDRFDLDRFSANSLQFRFCVRGNIERLDVSAVETQGR